MGAQPLNLLQVVAAVNQMELAPLVDRERAKNGVVEHFCVRAEFALTSGEDRVHFGDL